MRWLLFIIVLLAATVLNTGELLGVISVGQYNIRPDILLIMLVFFAAYTPGTVAITASFLTGLAADISGPVMGPYAVSFLIFGVIVWNLRRMLLIRRLITRGITIFFVSLAAGAVAHVLTVLKTGQSVPNAMSILFYTSLYSGIVGPFLWRLMYYPSKMLGLLPMRRDQMAGGPKNV